MAHFMLQSRLKLGGVDISGDGHLHNLQATHSQEEIEDTVFGDTFKNRICGLQDYQLSVQMRDDIADDALDEDIFSLWATNGALAVEWGYLQSYTEALTNPEYQFTAMMTNDQVGGGVGDGANRSLTILIASGSLTRDVT